MHMAGSLYSRNKHNIVKHYTPIKIKSLCKKVKKSFKQNQLLYISTKRRKYMRLSIRTQVEFISH